MLRVLLLGLACSDTCEQACAATSRSASACLEDWSAEWDDLGAASRQDFRQTCEDDWQGLRAELEAREIQQALAQCEDASATVRDLSCDSLRAMLLR